MTSGRGPLTPQERRFAAEYAATGDATYAATKAQYSHPSTSSSRVLARPAVQESIKRQQMARMNNELLPLALDTIEGILRNTKATDSNKLTAASLVAKYTVGQGEAGEDKEPHEMTADELGDLVRRSEERLQQLKREASERARPVIEAEASPIDEENSVFG